MMLYSVGANRGQLLYIYFKRGVYGVGGGVGVVYQEIEGRTMNKNSCMDRFRVA